MEITPDKDWTIGLNGRANTSKAYHDIVGAVAHLLRHIRLGDNVYDHARLIVSQLAHVHGMGPAEKH